jgi:hypothetical protein
MGKPFCVFLYRQTELDPGLIVQALKGSSAAFPRERFVRTQVKAGIEMACYFAGDLPTERIAFSCGAEFFLVDDFPERVRQKALLRGGSFRFFVWVSSGSPDDHYEVGLCLERDRVEGRALVGLQGERIVLTGETLTEHRHESLEVDPADFGLRGEDESQFDEDAYHAEGERRAEPYDPLGLVRKGLNVSHRSVTAAVERARTEGELLWPVRGLKDSPKLRAAARASLDGVETIPAIPLWDYLAHGRATAARQDE